MPKEKSVVKQLLAAVFLLMLAVFFVKTEVWKQFGPLVETLKRAVPQNHSVWQSDSAPAIGETATTQSDSAAQSDPSAQSYSAAQSDTAMQSDPVPTLGEIEESFTSNLWKRTDMIDLTGAMAKTLGMQGYYSDQDIFIMSDGTILDSSAKTTTDYEVEQTVTLRDFLAEREISLLYVNEPTKYIDDAFFTNAFARETWSNRNMDRFLSRIREAGVNAIDLRDNIRAEGLNVLDLFYRTDHHWTVPAGLWASRIMAEGLNQYCGYEIDLSLFDPENFETKERKACWLGEQGRKVGKTYVGLDDYTEVKPKFETDYTFRDIGRFYDGPFDLFIDEWVFDPDRDVYENNSWHHAYNRINCINKNAEKGKLLILGDSYTAVTHCFLSLGIHEVDSLILRDHGESFDLRSYIVENGYDAVLVAYAQFMVGGHDEPTSSSYRMFTFQN